MRKSCTRHSCLFLVDGMNLLLIESMVMEPPDTGVGARLTVVAFPTVHEVRSCPLSPAEAHLHWALSEDRAKPL